MTILGIDPGTAIAGYGVIQHTPTPQTGDRAFKCIEYGCITTSSSLPPAQRLQKTYTQTSQLIRKHKPAALAVESIYFFKNWKTAMPVSQAKGVIILAAAQKKVPVFEYTPLQIKLAVSGYGNAQKQQVQKMIQHLLCLTEPPRPDDAADALAAAMCHFYSQKSAAMYLSLQTKTQ